MKEAPIFVDAYQATLDIQQRLGGVDTPLAQRACSHALRLLEATTLALKGWDPIENLEIADRGLLALRLALRLVCDSHVVEPDSLLPTLERLDAVGRQLGGWQRKLHVES